MRNERVNISIYADASYFLMYRQVFFDVMGSVLYSNSQIEWVRFVAKGAQPGQAAALSNPVQTTIENMYNPYGGYATFIMPAILIVIIQQTLLIGIGMVGGTWRERGLYKTLIPWGEKRLSVIPIVLGNRQPTSRSTARRCSTSWGSTTRFSGTRRTERPATSYCF